MIKISVHDTQLAQDAVKKQLQKLMTDKMVLVGIHEGAGDHDGISNAQLGAVLHFGGNVGKNGSVTIPPRPWLDNGVAVGNKGYSSIIADSDGNFDNALELIGAVAVGHVQEFMSDLKDPANALSTIKKKGFNNPLIHTGNLRQSVTYSVTSEKTKEGIE